MSTLPSRSASHASHWRQESVLDIYTLVIAAFVFVSPWLFAVPHETTRLDIWFSGAAIAVTACAAILAYANWKEWINVLLGAWLIASPWVLGFTQHGPTVIAVGAGLAVTFLALVELLLVYDPIIDEPPTA